MRKHVIGIDIGGTTAKIGLFSRDDFPKVEDRISVQTDTSKDGDKILPNISAAISEMLEKDNLSISDIDGIGVGVPGPVINGKEPGTTLVNKCVNLGWGVKDVAGELKKLTGVENIVAINDANAAALGEVICGIDKSIAEKRGTYRDTCAVFVTIGTGIGGGIVMDGDILKGAFGAAGEIGHMKMAPQHRMMKKLVNAGLKPFGDLEYFASATGIARVAKAVITAYPDESELRKYLELDAKAVFDAARSGDGLAIRTTDFFFETLGTGLAAVASVVDPDIFIIGGGVAGAGDFLLDGLHWAYQEKVFHASHETEFRLAVLGNDAGMIGAAAAV